MKKIVSIILFAFLLNGCDDGNISVESIEFQDILPSNCTDNNSPNSLIFKLKEKEALLLYLPKTVFAGEPSVGTPLEPKRYNIDLTTYRVIYRAYNGKVTQNNMCDVIPPATPNVIEEWVATSGVIEVTTTAKKPDADENNATKITGYTYSIIFKDITFNKPSGPQTYQSFPFGDYSVTVPDLPLTFVPSNAKQCPVSKQVYNYNQNAALTIDNIDSDLIVNEVTPLNQPRTRLINDTTNKLLYRVFVGAPITNDYFCQTTPPSSSTVTQTWAGKNGIAGSSGIIEVSTTTNGNNFAHTITLKNVSLQKGNNEFRLGNSFVLGTIITTPN